MSKAFDLVNHQILLEILNSLGFRGHFSTLLKNYLSGHKFRIKSNYNYSQYYEINRGVPQGSIISPILYSLYVYNFSDVHSNVIQYADDSSIIFFYKNTFDLQNTINCVAQKVQQFMERKQLLLNTEKTEIVLFDDNSVSYIDFLNTNFTNHTWNS